MSTNQRLTGRSALVTGAGDGIGASIALALADQGAKVMVSDIRAEAARAVAETIGEHAAWAQLDVRDPASVQIVVDQSRELWGDLQIAVNNAGVGVPVPRLLHELDNSEWRRVLDVNLDGVFHSVRAELAAMVDNCPDDRGQRGSVVMVGSIGSLAGLPTAAHYVTAKHGLLGMTRAIAIDYASYGIRANLIAPGYVDTAISQRTSEQLSSLAAQHPIGRLGDRDEISSAACFLASPDSSFITGTSLPVDGGYTAR